MNKNKEGSHQSQDTKTKASGLRIEPIYFFPITEYCLQEVYSILCDTEVNVIMNTEQVWILHRERHNWRPRMQVNYRPFTRGS